MPKLLKGEQGKDYPARIFVGTGSVLDNHYRLELLTSRQKTEHYSDWLKRMIFEGDTKVCNALDDIVTLLAGEHDVHLVANGHYDESYVNVIIKIVNEAMEQ